MQLSCTPHYYWRKNTDVRGDPEQSGIQFTAHDFSQRQQRYSAYDLIVLGFRGDVKTSTYFLHVARSFPLANDFYLVRLYDVAGRSWLDVAMIKPAMWQAIDGDTMPCKLDEVAALLPTSLRVRARDEALVVITYEDWKRFPILIRLNKFHDIANWPASKDLLAAIKAEIEANLAKAIPQDFLEKKLEQGKCLILLAQ